MTGKFYLLDSCPCCGSHMMNVTQNPKHRLNNHDGEWNVCDQCGWDETCDVDTYYEQHVKKHPPE